MGRIRPLQGISVAIFSVAIWCCQYVILVKAGPLDLQCDPCVDRSKLQINAVVHGTLDDPFWQQIVKAMRQAGADMGVVLHVELWETFSSQAMADEIRSLINYQLDDSLHGHNHNVKQIDGLIVTIPDEIVKAAVVDAVSADIHVFGLNIGYQYATELGLLGYVAQNEYLAGALAAREFERRRRDTYGKAQRALFVNHDESNLALKERFRGFNDTLAKNPVEVDQIYVHPDEEYIMVVELNEVIEGCRYDYVLLAGTESAGPVAASYAHHKCGQFLLDDHEKDIPENNTNGLNATHTKGGPMMIAVFDGTQTVFDAIIAENVEFALTQAKYLQGALPVLLSTLYASTGKLLSLPYDRPVYNAGPHIVDIENVPSDTYQACQAEAFPICDRTGEAVTVGECPCIDRSRLKIAGVTHGVVGDSFWDTIIEAAEQAGMNMDVDLEVVRFPPQESEEILHKLMVNQIKSLCGSGVNGIFVTMPSESIKDAVRFCKQLRIPVVNINAGHRYALELDVQHIGQLEFVAGMEAGDRMVLAGVQEGYCLTPEPDNSALIARCEGFEEALRNANKTFGGVVEVPRDNQALYKQNVKTAVGDPDGNTRIGLLVNGDINAALALQRDHQRLALGAFDVRESLFEPLDDGRLLFTVDQQHYMQGAMAVYLLAYAAFTDQLLLNKAIETGPQLVEYSPPENVQLCEKLNYNHCSSIPKEDYNFISESWLTWGYATVGVVAGTGLFCLVWMQYYRQKNIVMASQPMFLVLLVLGAVLSVSSIIPQGAQTTYRYLKDPATGEFTDIPNPDIQWVDFACMLAPWLYGCGFVIMFSALCAKIHRIRLIYAAGAAMRRRKVKILDVVAVMAIMLALEVTILLCWTLLSPSKWKREPTEEDLDGFVLESVGRCTSEHHRTFLLAQLLFHAACLLYAVLLCWQTREIPTEFAEGSYISLSVLCFFQVAVLTIPIAVMVHDTPDVYYFVQGASVFLESFTVLCLIFFPKMWRVATGNDELPLPTSTSRRVSSAHTFYTNNAAQAAVPITAPGSSKYAKPIASYAHTISSLQPQGSQSCIDHDQKPNSASRSLDHNGASTSRHCNTKSCIQESPPVARMASLDSESDDDDPDDFAAKAMAAATVAGARQALKAGLDADSSTSSSSLNDLLKTEAQNVGTDNQFADLSAELSRVERARESVYNSAVGDTPPEALTSKALPGRPNKGGSKASNDVKAKTQFKRQDSPDVDSSGSCSSESDFGPGVTTGPLVLSRMPGRKKKRYRNFGEPAVFAASKEDKSGPSHVESLPLIDQPQHEKNDNLQEGYGKNPQEGHDASGDASNQKKELNSLESDQNEFKSTSTLSAGATGITKAEASKAEIFRKPLESLPSTPIRVKKETKAHEANAPLTLGSGAFLRKVAESFGSTSLGSSAQQSASLGIKTTSLDVTEN